MNSCVQAGYVMKNNHIWNILIWSSEMATNAVYVPVQGPLFMQNFKFSLSLLLEKNELTVSKCFFAWLFPRLLVNS